MQTQNKEENPETPFEVLPEPDKLQELEKNNEALRTHLAHRILEVKVLERDKVDILERLKGHEENSFSCVLANLETGDVLHNAGEQIVKLAELVEQRQEPGKLSLTITIKPFKQGAQVAVAELKLTEPKRESNPSIFFIEDGKITRETHRQSNLNL